MWEVRVISGPNSGDKFPLKEGENTLGRGQDSDIQIQTKSMSRKHFQIIVKTESAFIKDLNSRNGTFVNGVLIKQSQLNPGDKISVHQTVLEFARASISQSNQELNKTQDQSYLGNFSEEQSFDSKETSKSSGLKASLENIFMQGIYKVAEWGEFKWVVGSFIACYVVVVTVLSAIPMVNISKERIQQESLLRANDIGQRLANRYKNASSKGLQNSFSIEETRSEGVKEALIISAVDGHIIAPSKFSGNDPDLPFVHKARRNNSPTLEVLNSSTIGVSIPIQQLNPNTGTLNVSSFAIIMYDMGKRVFQTDDVIRLVVQVLAFALVLGFILFIMLISLIEKPILDINSQLDHALKDGEKQVSQNFNFPILQKLITNINSSLSRISEENKDIGSSFSLLPLDEANNLVNSTETPMMVIDNSHVIISINVACENLIGANDGILLNKGVDEINDQSLLLNIKDLISQAEESPEQISSNKLEFSSVEHNIKIVAIGGADSIKYFIITISKEFEEGL